eukprot:1088470-Pleurochrysis_carterae.AAC.1
MSEGRYSIQQVVLRRRRKSTRSCLHAIVARVVSLHATASSLRCSRARQPSRAAHGRIAGEVQRAAENSPFAASGNSLCRSAID